MKSQDLLSMHCVSGVVLNVLHRVFHLVFRGLRGRAPFHRWRNGGPERLEKHSQGFPGGSMAKNLLANIEATSSIPGQGKIPHATEQLSPCAATTSLCLGAWEPQQLEPAHSRVCAPQEKPAHHDQRVAPTHSSWRKVQTATKVQHRHKWINKE